LKKEKYFVQKEKSNIGDMKTKRVIFIAAILAVFSSTLCAQEVRYTYDAAGNRTGYEVEQQVRDTTIIRKVTEVNVPTPQQEVFTVRVYPNPVTSILHVALPDLPQGKTGSLDIYSSMGNPVLRQKQVGTAQSIDVSGIQQGHYVVRITAGKHTAIAKIVKL
jgi:hypothetical protein